jgi:hypothetical protein
MKLVSLLLLIVSLSLGTLAASMAYLVSLDLPDAELTTLTLNGPAGTATDSSAEEKKPLATRGTKLSKHLLAELRSQEVPYVRVKEFAWARWQGRWWFVAAVVGLLGNAVLVYLSNQRERASTLGEEQGNAASALLSLKQLLADLDREASTISDDGLVLRTMLARLGLAQATHLGAFVDARPVLIRQLGLRGFAEVMDRFAATERQINRAWSAAADGVLDEARACLEQARLLLDETIARLPCG